VGANARSRQVNDGLHPGQFARDEVS
jgi:hypothetical protein